MAIMKLSECCISISDGDHMPPPKAVEGIPFITISNISSNNELIFDDVMHVPSTYWDQLDEKRKARIGDVLYSVTGSYGVPVYIDFEKEFVFQRHIAILKPDPKVLSGKYLYYLLKDPATKCRVDNIVTGAVQKTLGLDVIRNVTFDIPSIEEQHENVAVLSAIDEKVKLNNISCSDLESMAKLLYDYWFVQFDFPDENGKPYRSSGGKMVWNKELKREIPDGWEVKRLPDVCDLQYGFPLSTDRFVPFGQRGGRVVRIRDIANNTFSAITREEVESEYYTKVGDLLVGMDGNFQMNYWPRWGDIVNQRITRIRKTDMPMMVIKMQIEPHIAAKVSSVARSTVGHLGDADFKKQLILVPGSMDLSFFDNALNTILNLRNENAGLASLRDFLLPMLMNGQVKVRDCYGLSST